MHYYGFDKRESMRLSKEIIKNLDNFANIQELMANRQRRNANRM